MNVIASEAEPASEPKDPSMSNYLYRIARFAFRRRRLVLAVWLAAAIAAIALAQASGGKTNDTFTIPGTEAQNAAAVLMAKLVVIRCGYAPRLQILLQRLLHQTVATM